MARGIDAEKDLKIVEFKRPIDVLEAVKSGKVDVGIGVTNTIGRALQSGLALPLWSNDFFLNHPCCRIVATEEAIRERCPEPVRFLKGLLLADKKFSEDPEAGVRADINQQKFREKLAHDLVLEPHSQLSADPNRKGVENMWNYMRRIGYAKGDLDLNKVIDTSLYEEAIRRLIELANRERLPVTVRGGGTGLAGGAVPVRGGLVIAMDRLNRILDIDADNFMVTVQERGRRQGGQVRRHGALCAGAARRAADGRAGGAGRQAAEERHGLQPDAAARRLGGDAWRHHRNHAPDGAAAYGAPGLAGAVSGHAERHRGRAGPHRPDGHRPRLHRVSGPPLHPGHLALPARRPGLPRLRRRTHLLPGRLQRRAGQPGRGAAPRVCPVAGAMAIEDGSTPERRERLWRVRRNLAKAFRSFSDFQTCEDISLPPARLPDMLEALQGIADSFGVQIASFGHAGDGNLHPRVVAPSDWTAERWHSELPRILAAIYRQTAALGGQLSGEHGIGEKRRDFIGLTVPPATLALMRAIKATLDPNGILNPDKILPD